MRKHLSTLAILAAASGASQAQSSVTLFGVVDVTVQQVRGATKVTQVQRGGINGSRIGFRGTEDLGGGLFAGFHLEAGIDPDTGMGRSTSANNITNTAAGGLTFNRRSTVQLRGGWGEVRLGRDYTPVADNHTDFDTFGNAGIGDASYFTQALAVGLVAGAGVKTDIRASNSIGYHLPSGLGGFYGNAMFALGENLASTGVAKGDGDHVGARFGWTNKTVNVALAYGKTKLSTQNDLDNWHLGATWVLGAAELFGQLSRERTEVTRVRHTNDAVHLGMRYTVGNGIIKASVSRSSIERAVGADSRGTLVVLGYQHNLSKRTALYGHYARVSNNANGTFDLGRPVNPGGSASGVQVGIRHRF